MIVFIANIHYAPRMIRTLTWPPELAKPAGATHWQHANSNISLDFHGDPLAAHLTVFSDGNHHMALQETVELFLRLHPAAEDVFYATTPPNILTAYLEHGRLQLGNLLLSRMPHVFISPANVMNQLVKKGFISSHRAFMQSSGNVLLITKDNPKNISGLTDLLRDDVKLFISNPQTEKASFQVYRDTLLGLAREQGLDTKRLEQKLEPGSSTTVFGECIHHREAPQALFAGGADVAMVYYHLALRYTRIFPGQFDFIPLGGSKAAPAPGSANVTTAYHAGLLNDPGAWGQLFLDFLFSSRVTKIYQSHGLRRP